MMQMNSGPLYAPEPSLRSSRGMFFFWPSGCRETTAIGLSHLDDLQGTFRPKVAQNYRFLMYHGKASDTRFLPIMVSRDISSMFISQGVLCCHYCILTDSLINMLCISTSPGLRSNFNIWTNKLQRLGHSEMTLPLDLEVLQNTS